MKYMLLLYPSEAEAAKYTQEEMQATGRVWLDVLKDAKAAGVLVANNGLSPAANATTVSVRGGKTLITDGPFAETHEALAGSMLLNCKDIDEAIAWAARIPTAAYGSVEIRTLWDNS